jgi:plasmid stabilization system protein ParE
MQSYKVEILQTGLDDLEADVDYIAKDSIHAAMRWYGEVVEKIQSLEAFPTRCPIAEESRFFDFEVRRLLIGSYRVLFRIVGNTVQVLHVRHGAEERNPFST